MKAIDDFKKNMETVKTLSGKEKLRYVWTYYKWHIIIPLFLIVSVGIVIYHNIADPDVALNGIILNAYGVDSEEPLKKFAEDYMKDQEMDPKEEIASFDISFVYEPNDESGTKNYAVIHGVGAWIRNGTADVMTADTESMLELTEASYFMNLSEVLTTKQLAKYSSKIIYVEGIPVLLDISGSENLSKVYLDQHEEMALAVTKGAPHIEEIRDFIDYLMK